MQAHKEAMAKISALMFEFDIRPNDLRRPRNNQIHRTANEAALSRSGDGATWTGRGHKPAWIAGSRRIDSSPRVALMLPAARACRALVNVLRPKWPMTSCRKVVIKSSASAAMLQTMSQRPG
ncbi:histone family protein nucleoid-structuring protein H-NS [Candidatus Paraburkholderia kirkii UZHbot1]|uniref:Histone family protein nucleoid-structuring protein H-NS n=1 Tax=Candidatus Paraburkholderia kirkii UZHbot1 TaxID=1055526 RepID=G4M5H9_9BURK|nr:histone family protein nucleoid-structuring protein H-NS [Candidatus Paraburkholderia kirkii UZHbot1]